MGISTVSSLAPGLLHDIHHVAVHVMRIETIDAHRHGFTLPVDIVQRLYDVLPRLGFIIRDHRVLAIQEDEIRGGTGRFLEHAGVGTGHGEFTALQPDRRRIVAGKTHQNLAWRVLRRYSCAAATPLPRFDIDTKVFHGHLGGVKRRQDHHFIQIAQVADTKRLAGDLAEAEMDRATL